MKKDKDIKPLLQESEENMADDVASSDEATAKIMALLANDDKFKVISELSDDEIHRFAALQSIAETYDSKLLQSYIKNYLLLKISKHRKGRTEVIELGIADRKRGMDLGEKLKGGFGRVFGFGQR
jgi:hypothetical protein